MAPNHSCWTDDESAKKVRKKRFGNVFQSDVNGLRNMLLKYKGAGTSWVEQKVEEWEGVNGSSSESNGDSKFGKDEEMG